jgi:hypothetical protein
MKWFHALALNIIALLAPIKPVLLATGVLIFADLILGVMAAKKRGEPITSSALRRTISKLFIYNITILSGFLFEKYLMGDLIPAVKLIAGVIGVVELKSILENADDVNGAPIFLSIIKSLGSQNDQAK